MKVNLDQMPDPVTWGAMAAPTLMIRIFALLLLLLGAPMVAAQANIGPTPRENLVDFIKTGEWPDNGITSKTAEDEKKPSVKPAKSIKTSDIGIMPFYLSGADYLKARGDFNPQAVKITYEVTKEDLKLNLPTLPTKITVQIGTDYAAVTRNNSTTLYDFKTRRKLSIRSGDKPVFTSQSLFADALRDVTIVNRNTANGQKSSLQVTSDKSLDAFWLESSVGWTARDVSDMITVEQSAKSVTATYDDKTVFEIALSDQDIPDPAILRSMIALWHLDWPVHPVVLAELGPIRTLPQSITALSYSPSELSGAQTKWTMTSSDQGDMRFPLDPSTPNLVHTPESSPLAFVIYQAALNEALGGQPSLDDLRDRIFQSSKKADWLGAWAAAHELADRQGGCENDPAILCEDLELIAGKAEPGSVFAHVLSARKAKTSEARLDALLKLYPATEDKDASALVLKTAGITRSKLKTGLSDKLKPISAGRLLEQALVKSPYDPEIYQVLSQIYAAQGRYVESWDMLDALRAMAEIDPAQFKSVEQVERSLLERAPGYFRP